MEESQMAILPWIIPALFAVGQMVGGALSNRASEKRQARHNQELASYQQDANERLLEEQLEYNSPKNQMLRFQQAGLNKNLIYGQGNPGNQASPLSHPGIGQTRYGPRIDTASALAAFNQTSLAQSQVQALDAKTTQTTVLTEVNRLQAKVLAANPLLDREGFSATIDSLKSAAAIKATQSVMDQSRLQVQQMSAGHQVNKIFQEVQLLEQRFKLAGLDAQLKAQVVTSKEFQNAILEVQKKWLTDAEITPQHIYQFIQMLLLKLL